jgi:hypothetical protein
VREKAATSSVAPFARAASAASSTLTVTMTSLSAVPWMASGAVAIDSLRSRLGTTVLMLSASGSARASVGISPPAIASGA